MRRPHIKDVVDRLELMTDVATTITKVLGNQQDSLDYHTRPLEELLEGLRLDFLSTKATLGMRNAKNPDIPISLWDSVELALNSCNTLSKTLLSTTQALDDTRESVDCLLLGLNVDNESKAGDAHPSRVSASRDLTVSFIEDKLGNSGSNKISPEKKEDGLSYRQPGQNHHNCDHDDVLCAKCFARMDNLEGDIINSMTRIANLEESKHSNVESAILIKDQIFRGRKDISAWLDKQFPEEENKSIEGGCFVTPHYILNLISADMCSSNFPKILLGDKELVRMNLKRPDATSYYALLTDKPDFMLTSKQCHGHVYKASKTEIEKSLFKFIPSYQDFGRSSDSESLHHRFRRSLWHVAERQERYIESRLADYKGGKAFGIAKQLLDDCLNFVREMLDFMEELYSACNDSFNASSEAWELVCNCLEDLFTKEFKPSLRFCVAQDLVDVRESMIGVVHTAFSLNTKVRELNTIRLKNHSSTTTSHVRFVMKMAKSSNKTTDKFDTLKKDHAKLQEDHESLKKQHEALKKQLDESKNGLKRLESRLDSHIAVYQKDKKSRTANGSKQE